MKKLGTKKRIGNELILIGLGLKLGLVPFFIFPFPVLVTHLPFFVVVTSRLLVIAWHLITLTTNKIFNINKSAD